MLAEYITALTIGFTEVTIYDFPGEEYDFRRRTRFSVVVSWSTSFHGRKRPTEKSFSAVVGQQAERLVAKKTFLEQPCVLLPCAEACELSGWSKWTQCSASYRRNRV